jgi:GH24 family phage-related lysozyme (muramidase)
MFIFRRSSVAPLPALILSLSLRKLWALYQRRAVTQRKGRSERDLALAQVAFYSGARGMLRVLAHMIERGDSDAALRTIRRFGKHVKAMQSGAETA